MTLYLKIIRFVKPFWHRILLAVLLTIVYVLFNNLSLWVVINFIEQIFSPEYIASGTSSISQNKVMDNLTGDNSFYNSINDVIEGFLIQEDRFDTLLAVCILILVAFVIKNIAIYLKKILLNYTTLSIVVKFRNMLQVKILKLPISSIDKRHTGEFTSIVFNDVGSIKDVLSSSFGNLILSPIHIITNITLMFIISVKLSLMTFIVVPVSVVIIIKIGQSVRRRSRRVLQQIANVMFSFQESMSSIRIVKAFVTENREARKFDLTNTEWFKKSYRANKLKFATSPLNEIVLVIMLVFLLWYGGNLVYNNDGIQAQDFLRFLIFLFTMFQPIKDLSGLNNVLQSGFAAAERIFNILDAPEEIYNDVNQVTLKEFNNNIVYDNVCFKYNPAGAEILKDLSFEIRRGEMVAFVGPSGSGKTTLVNLLPRFYQVLSGKILIDGVDTQNITISSLRGLMSIVTQDTILFSDTIRMNIAYGVESASDSEIIKAAQNANAWEFIQNLENGLDTYIGEKGLRLSGGQKQRISIARAILKNPAILILDEATSALDTESERLVQAAIDNLLKDRTVLVIAHRLSTIQNADRIVVLNKGEIEAIGKHNELLTKSKIYQKLSQNQFIDME